MTAHRVIRRTLHIAGDESLSADFRALFGPDSEGRFWVAVRGVYDKATHTTRLTLQTVDTEEAVLLLKRIGTVWRNLKQRRNKRWQQQRGQTERSKSADNAADGGTAAGRPSSSAPTAPSGH